MQCSWAGAACSWTGLCPLICDRNGKPALLEQGNMFDRPALDHSQSEWEDPGVREVSDGCEDFQHPIVKRWSKAKAPPQPEDVELWKSLEGHMLEPLLKDIDLVDLRFIIENVEADRPVPRWQDVPLGARINASNITRIQWPVNPHALSVLVLSYPWLDSDHPDKQLATLQRLLPCLKAFLQGAARKGDNHTVGLMMDYPCMPQRHPSGIDDRTPKELERYNKAVSHVYEWYRHPYTTVLIYDVDLPAPGTGHCNLRPYIQRGWCSFELRASCLMKHPFCLWSLAGYEKGGRLTTWGTAVKGAKSKIQSQAPVAPDTFASMLRAQVREGKVVFSERSDLEVVIKQYKRAFMKAFTEVEDLLYQSQNWQDSYMVQLAEALCFAKKHGMLRRCRTLYIWENSRMRYGMDAVREAIAGTGIKLKVQI